MVPLTPVRGSGGAAITDQALPKAVEELSGSMDEMHREPPGRKERMADESLYQALDALRREVKQLQRRHAATRAWCRGLEEDQARQERLLREFIRDDGDPGQCSLSSS